MLDFYFSRCGNKVKTVNNGADAIDIAKSEDFDLVLCDMSGYDVTALLDKLEKRPKIGIITGWRERLKSMEKCTNIDFVLRKPFDLDKLKKQINELDIGGSV